MRILPCNENTLEVAAQVLNSGGVVVIPTDTVYGLAASPRFPNAIERLYTIKLRDHRKPIALLAADLAAVTDFLGGELPPSAAFAAKCCWPGALTLVVRGEGIRVPDHAFTRELIRRCGGVLRVTSANMSGQRAATDAPKALAEVGLKAELVLDDGISPGGVASTVLKVEEDDTYTVLRPGPEAIRTRLGLTT